MKKFLFMMLCATSLVACEDNRKFTDTVKCEDGTTLENIYATGSERGIYVYKPGSERWEWYMYFSPAEKCRILR